MNESLARDYREWVIEWGSSDVEYDDFSAYAHVRLSDVGRPELDGLFVCEQCDRPADWLSVSLTSPDGFWLAFCNACMDADWDGQGEPGVLDHFVAVSDEPDAKYKRSDVEAAIAEAIEAILKDCG